MTKSLTAVVALQLVEEGKLDLEAPARRYAPDLAAARGRPRPTPADPHVGGPCRREYVYGSTRYAMLGKVIEAAGGASFEEAVRKRILARAGMQVFPSPALGAHAGLVSTTATWPPTSRPWTAASC